MNKYKEFETNLINKQIDKVDITYLNNIITTFDSKVNSNCPKKKKELLTNLNTVKTILETNKGKVIISW
jgi:hypothetical protein